MASILNVDQIGHSTSGTTALTVDSSGQVLLSAIPYMQMKCTDGTSFTKNNSAIIRFNNVIASRGITLNTSTYKFQVPVAGLYHFSGAVRWNNASSYLWWKVEDGSGTAVQNSALILNNGNSGSFATSAGSFIAPLAASTDYQITFGDGANNTASLDATGQTFMSIYLVGAN